MGLSSSQARLLHLTARMHQLEYKGAKLEAEKLKLANDSDKVYETYLNALEQTKFVASVLGVDASMTDIDLTANAIYSYKTLNNQYTLIARDNKLLIPSSVSENYKNTDNIMDFLDCYGLISSQSYTGTAPNPAYDDAIRQYEEDVADWDQANQDEYDDWQRRKDEAYAEWEAFVPEDVVVEEAWTETKHNDIYDMVLHTGCLNFSGDNCYMHVLASLLGPGEHTTSDGHTYTVYAGACDGSDHPASHPSGHSWCWNTDQHPVDAKLIEALKKMKPCLEEHDEEYAEVRDLSGNIHSVYVCYDDENSLSSCTKHKDDPDYSLYQKIIDLLWEVHEDYLLGDAYGGTGSQENLAKFYHFLAYDLGEDEIIEHPAITEPGVKDPFEFEDPPEPDPSTKPKKEDYIDGIDPTIIETHNRLVINDKNKGQWYVNLWHRMQGNNETPMIVQRFDYDVATDTKKYYWTCENKDKVTTTYGTNEEWNVEENDFYRVIPDELLNDPKWIRNAVLEGVVLIQEYDKLNSKFFDTSVSTTTHIHEVQDEKGLKKAEAQYEADMKKIDRKDRYYDTEIAKCENERNATKQEMETLKTVAKENVDRTFKLFS